MHLGPFLQLSLKGVVLARVNVSIDHIAGKGLDESVELDVVGDRDGFKSHGSS